MSALSAADAAAAALDVQRTGVAIAVVLRVVDGAPAERIIVSYDGSVSGSFGSVALDTAARELASEAFTSATALSRVVQAGDAQHMLYAEAHVPVEQLIVVGAGHIAVPLAAFGAELGFSVTVLDDREEYATEDRFADGVRVLRAEFETDPFAGITIDERTYLALVTRGHRWDFDCLSRLLRAAVLPRYIGMIGSRRRVRAALDALTANGIARDRLARVFAPIGLDIGADTPAEIAVSIVAEMIAVRRGHLSSTTAGNAASSDERERAVAALAGRERVLDRLLHQS